MKPVTLCVCAFFVALCGYVVLATYSVMWISTTVDLNNQLSDCENLRDHICANVTNATACVGVPEKCILLERDISRNSLKKTIGIVVITIGCIALVLWCFICNRDVKSSATDERPTIADIAADTGV
jgi:hypothetical protein